MGAWNAGNFGNDDAVDWLNSLDEHSNEAALRQVIDTINLFPEDEYLDAIFCAQALAAAELLATAKGSPPSEGLPETAVAWFKRNSFEPDDELLATARRAVDRILNNSELKELWQEGSANDEWHLTIIDLRRRLS